MAARAQELGEIAGNFLDRVWSGGIFLDLAKLDKAVATYLDGLKTSRTYIQTDKPLYQPGETIWFRADLRATKTFTATGPPTGAMVQLLSPRGAIVATKRVLVQGGVARNDFALAHYRLGLFLETTQPAEAIKEFSNYLASAKNPQFRTEAKAKIEQLSQANKK